MASLIDTKYGKLSRFEIYNTFAIKGDIDWIHELLHDDFMYVQDMKRLLLTFLHNENARGNN